MLDFINKYARNEWFSQNGEEGVLRECLTRMGTGKGHAVEIGGANGFYCSNTAALVDGQLLGTQWTGLMVEADHRMYQECKANWAEYDGMRVQCSRVDGKNVNAFVDDSCDVLSLDTDGGDYRIFIGLKARPKIVIIEIDSSIPPDKDAFNSDGGAGYRPMVNLGIEKGYFLLGHTGNLVLLDKQYKQLFPEVKGHPLLESELYFNRSWLKEEAA